MGRALRIHLYDLERGQFETQYTICGQPLEHPMHQGGDVHLWRTRRRHLEVTSERPLVTCVSCERIMLSEALLRRQGL